MAMTGLVWLGAALTSGGLALLGYCIAAAMGARRSRATGPDMQARLRRLVAVNLGALALSGLGLAIVVVGVMLG